MEELCPGCLCSGRKLNSIKETSVYYFYKQIVDEVAAPEELPQLSKVCWECAALLQKFQCFQQQVKCCYLELFMCLQQNSEQSLSKPSHLQCQLAVVISYPEVKADVEIKVETDEVHCEPETFVNGLTWGHNLEKNVPCVHENVTKQLNKKQSKENQSGKTKKKQKRKILKKKTKLKKELSESDHDFEDIETDFQIEPMDMKLDQKEKYIDESEMNVDESNVNFDQSELVNVTKEETDQFETEQNETSQAEMDDDVVEKVINVRSREQLPERPQCVECGKIFSSRKTYRYHLNVLHKGQNRHPCPKCGKVYQWKSNLGRHMRSHKARESGELYCVKCDKSFASVATYRQHIRISRRHVSESEFTFTCDECGKKFVSKTRLRDHVDWEHLNKIKFRCQLCNKPFKCHTSLYVHLQNVHRNKERRDNLCHVCGKSYQITQTETNSEENNFSPSDESDVDPNSSYISDDDINTEDEYYDDQLVKKQMHGNKRKCEKNIQKDKSTNTVSRRKKFSDNIQFNEVEVVAPEMQEGDEVVSAEIQIESPEGVSPEIQTESPEGVSPEIQIESPEGVSPEIQTESPEGVSPEIQTESPEGVSLEIQTESPEGVSPEIQTESPEGVSPEIQKDSCEQRHNYKKMGKRRWDRRNACFYCQELVTNYSRHLLRKHPNEIEVIKYKSINDVDLKVRKQKRQEITNQLRNKGNFSHNLKVCFDRDGEKTLLPVRRNTQESSPSAFTTCKICLGTFKRSTFYKHFKKCGAND